MGSTTEYDNSININDSIFIGVGRPDCKDCYTSNTSASNTCRNIAAITLFAVTEDNGHSFPLSHDPVGFDSILNPPAIDATAFYNSIEFRNWRRDWSQSHLSECSAK